MPKHLNNLQINVFQVPHYYHRKELTGTELLLYFRNILLIFGWQEADFVDFSFGKLNNIICKICFLIV